MGVFDYTINFIWDGFNNVLGQLAVDLPEVVLGLLIALFFIVLGWLIGGIAKTVLIKILEFAKLDDWAKQHNLKDAVGGIALSSLAGSFLKYYVILLFLQQAADSVNLYSIRVFLEAVVFFIPVLLFSLAVLVLGLLLGKLVRNKVEQTKHAYKKSIGMLSELIIIYLALVLALDKIGLDVEILKNAFLIAFSAFVIVLALVFGISLGLSFKKEAKNLVDTMRKELKEMQ
jgi:hypothetical protein